MPSSEYDFYEEGGSIAAAGIFGSTSNNSATNTTVVAADNKSRDNIAEYYSYFTDEEYTALQVASLTSCTLSLLGSLTIMYSVLSKNKLGSDLYHRLVFGMSCIDVIVTSAAFAMPFAAPTYTGLKLAIGTVSSCEYVAFFFFFYVGSYLYLAVLTWYFLLTVKHRKRQGEVSRYVEPYIHIAAFAIPIATGIPSLLHNVFNPSPLLGICTYFPYPPNCELEDDNNAESCERGVDGDDQFAWPGAFLTLISAIVGVVCTWRVYNTVRSQVNRNVRHSFLNELDVQQRKRVQAVGMQCVWYTAAFLNGFIWTLTAVALDSVYAINGFVLGQGSPAAGKAVFLTILCMYLFFPLQGFLNWFIYIRPGYMRWKALHPNQSYFWVKTSRTFVGFELRREALLNGDLQQTTGSATRVNVMRAAGSHQQERSGNSRGIAVNQSRSSNSGCGDISATGSEKVRDPNHDDDEEVGSGSNPTETAGASYSSSTHCDPHGETRGL